MGWPFGFDRRERVRERARVFGGVFIVAGEERSEVVGSTAVRGGFVGPRFLVVGPVGPTRGSRREEAATFCPPDFRSRFYRLRLGKAWR